MNILISNDDGYSASGIKILAKTLAKEHNVVVVAPMSERSGSSHAVNFFSGITYKDMGYIEGIRTCAVDGTPADCVLFAIKHLFVDTKFDVVISGINTTLNAGSDTLFSGTFGAAQEGTFHNIAGIAVSTMARGTDEYEYTADFILRNLKLLKSFAKQFVTVNVNIPRTQKADIKGVKVAPLAFHPYNEKYLKKVDENGNEYYIVDGHPIGHKDEESGGDCYLLDNGYITITPIQMLGTDRDTLNEMKKAEFEL